MSAATRNGDPPLLMTPGPTRVPERVLRAGARAMIHHRSPEFASELSDLLQMLRPVFGTDKPILPVHTTGRGAMEAALTNLFSRGDAIVFTCNGQFGEMWAHIAESYGLVVHRTATDWERDVDPVELDAFLSSRKGVKAVAVAYCDTSTGVRNDIPALARVARAHNAMLLVDGISSIGGMPFAFDEWDIDVAITASQKCLMASPGLAFVVLSDRAWQSQQTARFPRNYFDFLSIKKSVARPRAETPGTTPVHIVLQLAESLRLINEEGLKNFQSRHEDVATHARNGCKQMGLSVQCPKIPVLSPTLTALAAPQGVSPKAIREGVRKRGVLIAAGLDQYEPVGFRIGHMGDIRKEDVDVTLSALSEVLDELRS